MFRQITTSPKQLQLLMTLHLLRYDGTRLRGEGRGGRLGGAKGMKDCDGYLKC